MLAVQDSRILRFVVERTPTLMESSCFRHASVRRDHMPGEAVKASIKHMECAESSSMCLIVWLAQRQISAGAIAFTSQEKHFRWCRRWQLLDTIAHLQVQFALDDQRFDEITRMEGATQQTFRERIFDLALNGEGQRKRAVLGSEALFEQENLGCLRYNQFQLLFGQLGTHTFEQEFEEGIHFLKRVRSQLTEQQLEL